MQILRQFRLRLRSMLQRQQVEKDLDDELQFHLEQLTEQNLASGMNRAEARSQAMCEIGCIDGWKEQCRDQRGLNPIDNLLRDMRYTVRVASRNRLFSAVVVLSLALGVAATSAIFSVVYAMLVDPFPYKDAGRICALNFSSQGIRDSTLLYPVTDYPVFLKGATTLEESFAYRRTSPSVTHGIPESLVQVGFSTNAFSFLGVPMLHGRAFGPADIPSPDSPPNVAVLSQAFWRHYYGGRADAIGQTLELDHQRFTVIGIAPPRFTWNGGDVFVPMRPWQTGGEEVNIAVRPRHGISLAAVTAQIDALTHRLAVANPGSYPRGVFRMRAISMTDQLLGNARQTLIVLSAASAFLLLIACANVSILLFARASARQKEMAVRISLGASTGRILQQLLTEAVMLSMGGGVLGLLLASGALRMVLLLLPVNSIPQELVIATNTNVVLATFAACLITGILCGLLPATEASQLAVNQSLQEGGPGLSGKRNSGRSRGTLIAVEVSLTILLMAGAAITVQGLIALHQVKLGYDPSNVITVSVPLPEGQYTTWAARGAVFERILNGLESIRGVQSAAATEDALPPRTGFPASFEIAGQQGGSGQHAQIALVGGDYFPVLRIPVKRGRLLTADEIRRASPVAVISEEMARRYWTEGRDPIGARIHVPALRFTNHTVLTPGGGDQWFQVVGVVGTAVNEGLREPPSPSLYVSYKLAMVAHCDFLLRTDSDPHALIPAIRERIHEAEPNIVVEQPLTLDEQLSEFDRALPRFLAALFTVFGSVALALAATGLYSVVSYGVQRRTREVGIRIALGATRKEVLALMLGGTARYVAAGLASGLLASVAAARAIAAILPDWSSRDPLPFAMVIAVFIPIGAIASWIPARRATRIAPTAALRHE
jgi:predicted permease